MAAFNFLNGTFTSAQPLNVSGLFTWNTGTLTGSGAANANGGLLLNSSTVSLNGKTLNNAAGQSTTLTGASAQIAFLNGAIFNNNGTFLAQNNNSLFNNGGGGLFNNTGTFTRNTGTGTFTIGNGVVLNNTGTLSTSTAARSNSRAATAARPRETSTLRPERSFSSTATLILARLRIWPARA